MDKPKTGFSPTADKAVAHIIKRMKADGRLAYLLGYGSESFDLLTQAYAEANGLDVETFRHSLDLNLTYTPVTTEVL